MAETREPVQVAVNVMRARLTILGFNLAIITFQIKQLPALDGGVALPGIAHVFSFSAATALFIGMALSIIAMVSFIASCPFNRDGACDHWSLLAGDLLMYMALAQTVTGFFGAFHSEFERVALPDPQQAQLFAFSMGGVHIVGGIAWALAIYVGPLVSLLRSPFGRRINVALALVYLGLVLFVARVWTMALELEGDHPDPDSTLASWLSGLVAPLVW